MNYEKSCGAVVYRIQRDTVEYLIIKSKGHGNWGFPKGHVEEGESEEETALREVQEETGLNVSLCRGFRRSVSYCPKKDVTKEVVFFVAKWTEGEVRVQEEEIQDYRWLNYDAANNLLNYETDRETLGETMEFIAKSI